MKIIKSDNVGGCQERRGLKRNKKRQEKNWKSHRPLESVNCFTKTESWKESAFHSKAAYPTVQPNKPPPGGGGTLGSPLCACAGRRAAGLREALFPRGQTAHRPVLTPIWRRETTEQRLRMSNSPLRG